MEHLVALFEEKGIVALLSGTIMIFSIHLIWGTYKEKLKHTDEQIKHLDKEIRDLKGEMNRFSHIMASYMEQTIAVNDKFDEMNKRLDEWLKSILIIRGE